MELIKQQSNFDINTDHDGFTALHCASVSGNENVVEWLLRNGADFSKVKNDEWKDTALHYAASKGHLECVRVFYCFNYRFY